MKTGGSASTARNQVIHFHHISFTKPLTAFPAFPFLSFEQLGYSRRPFRVITESRPPIDPVSVVRAPRSRHLHVALIMRFIVSAQLRSAVWGPKLPASVHVPILAHDPAFALLRMTTFCPGVEHC